MMRNLHEPSELLNQKEFNSIEKTLQQAWSRETTHPETKDGWATSNKALGQCAPTAIVINDLYGGRIALDKTNNHLWNILPDGSQQDFSRCQFKKRALFTITKYKTKEQLLGSEYGKKTRLNPRYELLKRRFQQELKKVSR